jgi:hypothetical protein
MKKNKLRILGFGMIFLAWIFWGLIILIPFLKLGVKTSAAVIAILLIGTNVFWVGAALVGKELVQKYNIWPRIRSWFRKKWPGKNRTSSGETPPED